MYEKSFVVQPMFKPTTDHIPFPQVLNSMMSGKWNFEQFDDKGEMRGVNKFVGKFGA